MLQTIEQLMRTGNWQAVESACRDLLLTHPTNPKVHAYLGLSYFKRGFYEQSVDPLKRATILDPNFADAGFKLAQALNQTRRYKEALQVAREYHHICPNNAVLEGMIEFLSSKRGVEESDAWERTRRLELESIHGSTAVVEVEVEPEPKTAVPQPGWTMRPASDMA